MLTRKALHIKVLFHQAHGRACPGLHEERAARGPERELTVKESGKSTGGVVWSQHRWNRGAGRRK